MQKKSNTLDLSKLENYKDLIQNGATDRQLFISEENIKGNKIDKNTLKDIALLYLLETFQNVQGSTEKDRIQNFIKGVKSYNPNMSDEDLQTTYAEIKKFEELEGAYGKGAVAVKNLDNNAKPDYLNQEFQLANFFNAFIKEFKDKRRDNFKAPKPKKTLNQSLFNKFLDFKKNKQDIKTKLSFEFDKLPDEVTKELETINKLPEAPENKKIVKLLNFLLEAGSNFNIKKIDDGFLKEMSTLQLIESYNSVKHNGILSDNNRRENFIADIKSYTTNVTRKSAGEIYDKMQKFDNKSKDAINQSILNNPSADLINQEFGTAEFYKGFIEKCNQKFKNSANPPIQTMQQNSTGKKDFSYLDSKLHEINTGLQNKNFDSKVNQNTQSKKQQVQGNYK